MIRREDALEYHTGQRAGKIELRATKACLTPRDMRLAYLPGAAFPSEVIAADRQAVFQYTARGNLVGVITNGTAVPGLGDVGPEAAKPMQEGMAVLFKRLADIDVFDLELDTRDPDQIVEAVRLLEPTFGGINLKDIRAPEGLYIYDRLCETLRIPVLHENLHGTAVVATAALINALALVEKSVTDIRVVICGAGTVGLGCARLFGQLGVRLENLYLYDKDGLIHADRDDLTPYQRAFARRDGGRTLPEGLRDADVFLGASAGGVVSADMVRTMNRYPIVFALATPEPEIAYDAARGSRRDVIVATGLAVHPNAVVDLLSFPYIFRGALDVQAARISEGMLLAAAQALADLAREDVIEEVSRAYGYEVFSFGPEYLLPKPIDPRVLVRASAAVARQAVLEGIARRPVEADRYEESLTARFGAGRETMRQLTLKARRENLRVVFPEGTDPTILRACGILVDEGIARPVLLGRESEVRAAIDALGLDLGGVTICDPERSPQAEAYQEEYFRLRCRRGVTRASARKRLRLPEYFGSLMLHAGDADLMVSGLTHHFAESLRAILEVIGPAEGVRRVSSHHLVLMPKGIHFLADCAVNVAPGAEDLAETALLCARMARALSIEPHVAMLSFSNFGSVDHPFTRKVRRAAEIVRERAPELDCDGEMQLQTAVSGTIRREYFPFSRLLKNANVLVFPDLQSGNLALDLLRQMGDAVLVGPLLMGTRLPAHVLRYGSSVEEVVNLVVTAVVQSAAPRS